MKSPARTPLVPLVPLVLLLSAAALAAAADVKAVGVWDAVATTPNGDMPSVITIAEKDGTLKAEIEIAGVPRTVTNEKLEGAVFRMTVQYEGGYYDVESTIEGDTLEGTWQGDGASGTLKAKRRP